MEAILEQALMKEFVWAMRYIDHAALSKSSQKRARLALAKLDKALLTMITEQTP